MSALTIGNIDVPYEAVNAAYERAVSERRPVALVFDGSDWRVGTGDPSQLYVVLQVPQAA